MANSLAEGRLDGTSFDRWSCSIVPPFENEFQTLFHSFSYYTTINLKRSLSRNIYIAFSFLSLWLQKVDVDNNERCETILSNVFWFSDHISGLSFMSQTGQCPGSWLWSGTAWSFLRALQLKLLFTVKQRVERMMKICLEVSAFFCNLHCLLRRFSI